MAAIAAKKFGTGLRYWYPLSALTVNGQSYDMRILLAYLMENFGIGKRNAYGIVQKNDGVLWSVTKSAHHNTPSTIKIFSVQTVADNLGVTLRGITRHSDAAELQGRGYRKYIWRHLRHHFQESSNVPLSRATLVSLTGIPKRSQQHYDDVLGEQRITHLEVVQLFPTIQQARVALLEGVANGSYGMYTHSAAVHPITHGRQSIKVIGIFRKLGNSYVNDSYIPKGGGYLGLAGLNGGRGIYYRRVCNNQHISKEVPITKITVDETSTVSSPSCCVEPALVAITPWLTVTRPGLKTNYRSSDWQFKKSYGVGIAYGGHHAGCVG